MRGRVARFCVTMRSMSPATLPPAGSRALGFVAALLLGACKPSGEQAASCEQYSACVRAQDQLDGVETNLDRFDPGGACWGSEEQSKVCERACTRGLAFERARRADAPPECGP